MVVRCVTFSDGKFIKGSKPEFNGLSLNLFYIKGQICNYFKQSVENCYTVNFSELIVFCF